MVSCLHSEHGYTVTNILKNPDIKQSCVTWNDAQINSILAALRINDVGQFIDDPEQQYQDIQVTLPFELFDILFEKNTNITHKAKKLIQRYIETEIIQILIKLSEIAKLRTKDDDYVIYEGLNILKIIF